MLLRRPGSALNPTHAFLFDLEFVELKLILIAHDILEDFPHGHVPRFPIALHGFGNPRYRHVFLHAFFRQLGSSKRPRVKTVFI